MEENNSEESTNSLDSSTKEKEDSFNLVSFDSEMPSQRVFKLFGYELIAPSGMKSPGLIYILFIIVNLVLFIFLRSKL